VGGGGWGVAEGGGVTGNAAGEGLEGESGINQSKVLTETKKQSPNTGARANNTLHK